MDSLRRGLNIFLKKKILFKPLKRSFILPSGYLNKSLFQHNQYKFSSNPDNIDKNPRKMAAEEFTKMASEELTEDKVFADKEQRISFKLLNAKSAYEIIDIYKAENSVEDPLNGDMLSLIFYFLCAFKEKITENEIFIDILNKTLQKLSEVSTVYLLNLLWSLGMYRYHFQLRLSQNDKENINNVLTSKMELFNFQQISSVSFAIFQIYSEPNDKPQLAKLLSKASEILLQNENQITKIDIINYLIIFLSSGYRNEQLLNAFKEILMRISNQLTEEELDKIISLMSELKYDDKNLYTELINKFLEIENSKADSASNIIFSLSNIYPEEKQLLKSLLKIVHMKWNQVNITNYINLWLALSKFKIKESDFNKTLGILKMIPNESKIFQWNDLEGYEFVNIIIALSVLKINDKPLMDQIIKGLRPKLDGLSLADLVNLARCFITYVRVFETFFVEIHSKCCDHLNQFTKNEKELLKKTFQRVKVLFPNSPFVDNTL